MVSKKKAKNSEVGIELAAGEQAEDIVSQLNVAVTGRHGLIGAPSLLSEAAAARNDSLPCTKKEHNMPVQIVVQILPNNT